MSYSTRFPYRVRRLCVIDPVAFLNVSVLTDSFRVSLRPQFPEVVKTSDKKLSGGTVDQAYGILCGI